MTTIAGDAAPATALERKVGAEVGSLFREHARMVLGICRLRLRDPHEAEDAAQETFLAAYRSLLGGTEPRDPAAWLATIARNVCWTRLRKRVAVPGEGNQHAASALPDPADEAADREELAGVKSAIADLPARQREAVVLRDFYGLSYEEVAAAISSSPPAVEALLSRGRRRVYERVRGVPRLVHSTLAVPVSLHDQLARRIPGFEPSEAAVGIAGGASAVGGVTKILSTPLTAKLAAATVAAVAIGVPAKDELGRIFERSPDGATPAVAASSPPALVRPLEQGAGGAAGPPSAVRSGGEGERGSRTGPGGRDDEDTNRGSSGGTSGESGDDGGDDDNGGDDGDGGGSGSGSNSGSGNTDRDDDADDDSNEGSGGSGPSDPDDDEHEDGDDGDGGEDSSGPSDSSGPGGGGSSGSGSGSGSSGSGSGGDDDPDDDERDDD